jgi:hypothetical protein
MDDRERTRKELRDLLELAKTPVPPDSSGHLDLAAFSESDPQWADHALARKEMPSEGESMRPVALSGQQHDTGGETKKRRYSAFAILMGAAYAVALAVLAIVIVKRFESPTRHVQAAGAPVAAQVDISPLRAVVAPPPSIAPATPATTTTAAPSPHPIAVPAPNKKQSPPAATSPAPAAQTRVPPRAPALPKSNSGGDPLLNAMQQSLH